MFDKGASLRRNLDNAINKSRALSLYEQAPQKWPWVRGLAAGLQVCRFKSRDSSFTVFTYSYRNTSGSLGEREIEVVTRARRASVYTQFRVLPNFHECFYN